MRTTTWLGGGILLAATAILSLISVKFLGDTMAQASARGITLTSAIGVTIARVGLGGFPLAGAIVTAALLVTRRVRWGLWFVIILFGTVLGVRVVSAATNGSLAASVPVIIPEVLFVSLSLVTLLLARAAPARTE